MHNPISSDKVVPTKEEVNRLIGAIYRRQQELLSSVHSLDKLIVSLSNLFDSYADKHETMHHGDSG